jgi:hypothetical protein
MEKISYNEIFDNEGKLIKRITVKETYDDKGNMIGAEVVSEETFE